MYMPNEGKLPVTANLGENFMILRMFQGEGYLLMATVRWHHIVGDELTLRKSATFTEFLWSEALSFLPVSFIFEGTSRPEGETHSERSE